MLEVPAGQNFVITDIIPDAVNGGSIGQHDGANVIVNFFTGFNQTPLHLETGFKVSSGGQATNITVVGDTASGSVGCVSITGYFH